MAGVSGYPHSRPRAALKTALITPAHIRFGGDDSQPPEAPDFNDTYHPQAGALTRARQVFVAGAGLPERWQGRSQFVVLETGFGLGNNFLATWDAWQRDHMRCERLHYVAVERHPPRLADLEWAHRLSSLPALATELLLAWPALTANVHTLTFEGGRVTLLLGLGDVAALLPALRAPVDAFLLDGFAPARNPDMWQPRVLKALGRMAAQGATLVSRTAAPDVRAGLATAGFQTRLALDIDGKRDSLLAVHQRRSTGLAQPVAAGDPAAAADLSAVVVGAGLAGAAAARALALHGFEVTVLESLAEPAMQASGNAAGLFHGTVHADDGSHARLHRAAALFAARIYGAAMAAGVPGEQHGLLRLELRADALAAMQALIQRRGWPPDYVQALSASEASARAGVPLSSPAWFYPGGGWISPRAWVQHALSTPGVQLKSSCGVAALQRSSCGWQALGTNQLVLAQGRVLVLANAQSCASLLQPLGHPAWPLHHTRGQVTQLQVAAAGPRLKLPLAGDGYVLSMPAERACDEAADWLCGATSAAGEPVGDTLPEITEADHRHNLMRMQRLTGQAAALQTMPLRGRAAWRLNTADRLPIAGAMALPHWRSGQRQDQLRLLPREPGLFVLTALGARGLTLAPLLAQLIASQAGGAPWPLEQDLADAVDPARWRVRAARRSQAGR